MGKTKKKPSLRERLGAIRLVVFDVDGTLTDGTILLGGNEELKLFHIADGLGIKLLMDAGIEVAFVTGRPAAAVTRRAKEIGVRHVIQGEISKRETVAALAKQLNLKKSQIASMGDDLLDLPAFAESGVCLAVADTAPEVIAAADWVSSKNGGRGAAREAAELILRAQGKWEGSVDRIRRG